MKHNETSLFSFNRVELPRRNSKLDRVLHATFRQDVPTTPRESWFPILFDAAAVHFPSRFDQIRTVAKSMIDLPIANFVNCVSRP